MMVTGRAKQAGVALIQVLITTAIIMLLVIYFLNTAKSQVDRASALQNKTAAYLSHYTANNQVLYALLTTGQTELQQNGWNFHGLPFKVNENTEVAIQDLNGLISLASLTDSRLLKRILEQSLSSNEAEQIADSVLDWVDADNVSRPRGAEQANYSGQNIVVRNGPVQTLTEFAYIHGMTLAGEEALMTNTTVQPTPFFNPMTAPEAVLAGVMTDASMASAVVDRRKDANYDQSVVESLTQIHAEDGINYFVGPGFRLSMNSQVADSFYGKELEYGIFPYRDVPVEVYSRLPPQQLAR